MTDGTTLLSFAYNADGQRVSKTVGGTTFNYTYANGVLTHMQWGSNYLHFIYDTLGPAAVDYNGDLYYYLRNAQGDITGLVNTSGTQVVAYSYDAWGKLLTTTGTMATTLGVYNPLRYRGYVYDTETGLYYLTSRYYNPSWGRFINADTTAVLTASPDKANWDKNLFAYCDNNPVMRKDDGGQFWLTSTIGVMVIGGLIGAGISAISSAITQQALTGSINWKSVGVAAASGLVSGAIAASPLGLVGQQIAGGIIGGVSYAADCYVNNRKIKLDEAAIAVGFGVISGRIGGNGANHKNAITTSARNLDALVAREANRANQAYAQKAIASATRYCYNKIGLAAWSSSIKFAAGQGVANAGLLAFIKLAPFKRTV